MIPIYIKTVYSFLSSVITIDDLITFAKKKNFSSLCICDDNMYGVMEFIKKCHLNNIKPIVGLDIDGLLLFAKNYNGYQNLMMITTLRSSDKLNNDALKGYSDSIIAFINKDNKDSFEDIFKEHYLYDNDSLHKTLCLEKKDTEILYYLNLLRDGKRIDDEYTFDNNCYYVESEKYSEIINKCNLVLPEYELNIPDFCKYNDTKGLNSDEYLYNLSIIGLNKRLNNKVTIKYKDRLLYELDVIKKMGFSNYFLIVYDYIKYAKSHNILVGPGRGSAAGSLVGYSLGITEVDPLKYDLLFERFLNIERVTMPDIDTDFPDEKRDEVIEYVKNKYGIDKVSLITTFGTFGSKMALRDMGRVLNVPVYAIDNLCKKIGTRTLREGLDDEEIKKIIDSDNKIKKLYEVSLRIEGIPRHTSVHAAGVIMADEPLVKRIPLVFDNDMYLSCYESIYLEELGLLKMDFLGIRNLTIIDNTLNLIKKYQNKELKFNDISLDDKETIELFQRGDTSGIFQFESFGMKEFLRKLKPNCFEDIYNANAFFRPGPSSSIESFIRRIHKQEKIDYYDDRLEPILKSTCGIIVYQEQIMQIASVMANFTLGEADILRRAMSKKKKEEIEKFQDKFINNSIKNGYDKELVIKIFNLILNFASYGFNKSHSVAYSMVSFKMAYLKAHYPMYFYISLLSSITSDEEKVIHYIKEMKRKNIKISKPDINKSMNEFIISYNTVILPFNVLKGIGYDNANKIIKVREEGFTDIYDFFQRIVKEGVPVNVIELLIKSGTLDNFGYNRNTLMNNMESLINYGNLCIKLGKEFVLKPEITDYEEFSKDILINNEKEVFGFYLTNHPVTYYKNKIKSINLIDIKKYFNKNIVAVVMIDYIREIITKKGDKMAFLDCSDEEGEIDVTVFPNLYQTLSNLKKSDIIIVEGRVERRSDYGIIATSIKIAKENV